jgi:hypothetical protein
VELTRISIRTDDGSSHYGKNSDKFIKKLRQGAGRNRGAEDANPDTVSYSSNRIDLAYRSNYENAIEYLEKLRGLPYAISFLSINISPEEKGTRYRQRDSTQSLSGKEMMITTKIEMDIFSR